jgi:hypothetical protein
MTDLEKLRSTKQTIDSLAEGINPLSGKAHESDSLLNDAAIIRCFFHVSQILEEVLRNGGVVGYSRRKDLKPFTITEEQKAQITLSETPVSITGLVGMINSVANNPAMRRLTPTQITSWLEQAGFLTTVVNAEGKNQRVPTDNASLIGISQVERKNAAGTPFLMNLYNLEAQQFILDNMDAILSPPARP